MLAVCGHLVMRIGRVLPRTIQWLPGHRPRPHFKSQPMSAATPSPSLAIGRSASLRSSSSVRFYPSRPLHGRRTSRDDDAWSGLTMLFHSVYFDFQTILINEDFRNVSDCPLPDHAPKPDETPVLYVDNESSAQAPRCSLSREGSTRLAAKGEVAKVQRRQARLPSLLVFAPSSCPPTRPLSHKRSSLWANTVQQQFPDDDPPPRRKRDAQALPVHEGGRRRTLARQDFFRCARPSTSCRRRGKNASDTFNPT